MHADEAPTADDDLVRHLVSDQFPEWSDLPIPRLAWSGRIHD